MQCERCGGKEAKVEAGNIERHGNIVTAKLEKLCIDCFLEIAKKGKKNNPILGQAYHFNYT